MIRVRRLGLWGFVLLDVILSITILSVVVITALRVFHQSVRVARRSDITTRAVMYAEAKMQEFEIEPPDEGTTEGSFGDEVVYNPDYFQDADEFRWEAAVVRSDIEYPDVRLADRDEERMMPLTQVHLRIIHDDGEGGFEPWVPVEINTYLLGNERFSNEARRLNGLF